MTKKNICASCKSVNVKKIIKTDNNKLPKWLEKKDYVKEFIKKTPVKIQLNPNYITNHHPRHHGMNMTIDVGKKNKNKLMLYWSAESNNRPLIIKNAKKAYGKFKNYGVIKVSKDGNVKLDFNCPQPYSTIEKGKKQKETFYRHIHFCFSNKSNTEWLETVYTKIVICDLSLIETRRLHKLGYIVLINALPCEYYAKSHIPNSYNLFNKIIKKMTQNELFDWFAEVIKLNYPKIHDLVKSKKINIYEVPIVVYCAHDKCNAGYLSAVELLKKGFVNILDFKGGMKAFQHFIK